MFFYLIANQPSSPFRWGLALEIEIIACFKTGQLHRLEICFIVILESSATIWLFLCPASSAKCLPLVKDISLGRFLAMMGSTLSKSKISYLGD